MPVNTESLNRRLYNVLARYKPKPLDVNGNSADIEDIADVFKFTFSKDGKDYGDVYATIDDKHNLNLYYDDSVTECPSEPTPGLDYDDSWSGFIQFMKQWAFRNRLGWHPENNKDHLVRDMARRKYMKKQENISEGYYAMGKKASYSDNVPTVKMVIQHNREIQEGEQRYRNVARIFLENQLGERILAPTTKPGIARIYARHIAEGGLPHDTRWNHINGLCEEYSKMAGFVRATRGHQFNESAQKLVESGIQHYQSLRESLSKMTGKRGYNNYFESWTPPLMEDETDTSAINELFVQETLDPRIESVMPILNKLHKKVSEMKEVDALAEWADSIDKPKGDENKTAEKVLSQFPMQLGEEESLTSNNPQGIPESVDDDDDKIRHLMRKYGWSRQEAIEYYYYHEDEHDDSDWEGSRFEKADEGIVDTVKKVGGKVLDKLGHGSDEDLLKQLQKNMGIPKSAQHGKPAMAKSKEQGVAEGGYEHPPMPDDYYGKDNKEPMGSDDNYDDEMAEEVDTGEYDARKPTPNSSKEDDDAYFANFRSKLQQYVKDREEEDHKKDMTKEGLDANQKRVGQLGPTSKVKNNNIGKLVGANESFINTDAQAVTTEDTYNDDVKRAFPGGKASGVKTGEKAPKGTSTMPKDKEKAKGKPVAEGQEDFDAMMRILKK